jgi:hypothetical protein
MQHALHLLQQASPKYFTVDPMVPQAKAFPRAIKAFREVIHAYLPADQGQLLMHAAGAVMELYSETLAARELQAANALLMSEPTEPNGAFRRGTNKTSASLSTSSSSIASVKRSSSSVTSKGVNHNNSTSPSASVDAMGSATTTTRSRTNSIQSSKTTFTDADDLNVGNADPSSPLHLGRTNVKSVRLDELLRPKTLDMLLQDPSKLQDHLSVQSLFPVSESPVKTNPVIELREVSPAGSLATPSPGLRRERQSSADPPQPESVSRAALEAVAVNNGASLHAVADTSVYEQLEVEKSRTESKAHAEASAAELQSVLSQLSLSNEEDHRNRNNNIDDECAAQDPGTWGSTAENLVRGSLDGGAEPVAEADSKDEAGDEDPTLRTSILSAGSDKEGIFSSSSHGFYEVGNFVTNSDPRHPFLRFYPCWCIAECSTENCC